MADSKISALPASTTPLAGTEVLPIVQSSATKQVSVANLTAGRAVSAASLSLTTPLPVASGGTGVTTSTGTGNTVLSASPTFTGTAAFAGISGGTSGTGFIFSGTAPAKSLIVEAGGNLSVGTDSSAVTTGGLYYFGPVGTSEPRLLMGHATGTGSGAPYIHFYYAGTSIGSITQSGTTAVLYNLTSDQRLKENIQDAASASDLIDSLKVRQFDWKADGNHQRYGFVAQELVTVAPEAVHQPTNPEEMMAVDYSKLVPMLVKEVQSLRTRLAQLESKV